MSAFLDRAVAYVPLGLLCSVAPVGETFKTLLAMDLLLLDEFVDAALVMKTVKTLSLPRVLMMSTRPVVCLSTGREGLPHPDWPDVGRMAVG